MAKRLPEKLRVILLSYRGNMFCGGQGVYLTNLARALAGRGHAVRVLAGPPYPAPVPGVELEKLPDENFVNRPAADLPASPFSMFCPLTFLEYGLALAGANPEMLAFSLRSFMAIRRLLTREPAHVVHDNQGLGYGLLLIRALGLPVVATIHHPLQVDRQEDLAQMPGLIARARRSLYYPPFMQRLTAQRLDGVIAVSKFAGRMIAEKYGLDPMRMTVVANGVDPRKWKPLPEISREPGRLLFVGSTEDRKKGVLYLLEALKRLPPKFHLVLVDGRRYPGRVYAADLVERLGLSERVVFRDQISDAELLLEYNRAETVMMPSLFEGFGLPALEAMACGAPLICTTAGALPEVADAGCAVLCKPRSAEALASAARRLAADPEARKKMGEAGRERAVSRFSWERAAGEVEAVYYEALERRLTG